MGNRGRSVYSQDDEGGGTVTIRFGCQTYTWQMSYDKYKDRFASILDVIAQAGFRGVEAEVCMLGRFYDDPAYLADALAQRGLELAALTLAEPWLELRETAEERANADKLLSFLRHFPQAKLILVQLPGQDRSGLADRQRSALSCVNAVGRRAAEAGIVAAYHPNSPAGSAFRTADDYKVLFDGLDSAYVGYCPDSGHIANGGMDVLAVFRAQMGRIKHVHFKDFAARERQWRTMGEGSIPHPELVQLLKQSGYTGWVMVEEESAYAEQDPDGATLANGKYIGSL
jgi:inosose dehydratase